MRPGRPRRSALLRWLLLVGLMLLLGACAGDQPQNALDPEGPVARVEDQLWDIVFPVAVAVFVLVQALLIIAMVRFRARGDDSALPRQVHGNTKLEILWTVIPALILAFIAIPTVSTIFALAQEPEDPLRVRVLAKQYFWQFEYEDYDIWTANELHIPVDRPVYLSMEAVAVQDDPRGVIHSFWIPKLAGKQDTVPGHIRHLTIEADEPGEYSGQCAEFCGLSHANMQMFVIAQPEDEFEEWLEEQSRPARITAEHEEAVDLFIEATCIACHRIDGIEGAEANFGPSLTHFADRQTFAGAVFPTEPDLVAAWIKNPQAMKPGAQMPNLNLSDEQIEILTDFLMDLE